MPPPQERKIITSPDRLVSFNRVAEAVRRPEVFGFLAGHVPEFYALVATQNQDQARQLVRYSFSLLKDAAQSPNRVQALTDVADTIYRDIFQQEAPDFWFTSIHTKYKVDGKPQLVVPFLETHLAGDRILDLGGGAGYLSAQLQRDGYRPEIADVIDYRAPEAEGIPFQRMASPTKLPHADDFFDSAFLFEVLHHVDDCNHVPLLQEAGRVANRVVVIENVYGDMNHPLLHVAEGREDPGPTHDYLALAPEDQFRTLTLMDYYVNIAAKGIVEMNIPFRFKTIDEWVKIFDSAGLEAVDMTQVGFLKDTLNRNFQLYFTLERKDASKQTATNES